MSAGAPKTVWTAQVVEITQGLLAANVDDSRVAELAGVSFEALRHAIYRGIVTRPPLRVRAHTAANVVEWIERDCNCCGRKFMAETKFIRQCDSCKAKGSPLGDWGLGVV